LEDVYLKVELLQTGGFDSDLLASEVLYFRDAYLDQTQFSVTSILGDDNFTEGCGTTKEAESYTKLNPRFHNTSISKLVSEFPEYNRWRILCVPPRKTYSVHRDGYREGYLNKRIHIPVVSNPEAFLCFYEHRPRGNGAQRVEYHNLKVGEIYEVNTTMWHTAVNYDQTHERIHIVAEKYIKE
jgi:hypothetical protein